MLVMLNKKREKVFCSPLDKIICPICCAANRLKKIDCNEDCRHLSGVALQIKRAEEKEFSELMNRVPHGQYDDIFKEPAVAFMSYEIETFIRDIYVKGDIRITDKTVRDAYKNVYSIQFKEKPIDESQLDELTKELLELYSRDMDAWRFNMQEEMIGQVFLRLMISVKKISGGTMGEFGYLNYLKNNLGRRDENDEVVVEDKFGRKATEKYK